MSRSNTGATPSKRVTAREAMDAYTAMLSLGTSKHTPAAWREMGRVLEEAVASTKSVLRREDLLHYASDCRGWAKRAEIAAQPAGIFGARKVTASTMAPAVDNAGWIRADAEIDEDDNCREGSDDFAWGWSEQ